jgi:ribulose-5-phosphate 4-epimerase/fuculose-1-phosphate aldolase
MKSLLKTIIRRQARLPTAVGNLTRNFSVSPRDWRLSKEQWENHIQSTTGMSGNEPPSEAQLRFDLAVAHQLLAEFKMDDLCWNHTSARLSPASNTFLITPFPKMFEEVDPDSLVSGSENETGSVIHGAVYDSRPDVHACVHVHSPAILAVSCLEEGLQYISQESCSFYGKLAYQAFEGMEDDFDEQAHIQEALGATANTLIMQNHGAVTTGRTVGEAWVRMYYLEKACRVQLDVMQSGGKALHIPEAVVRRTAAQYQKAVNAHGASEWPALVRWWAKKHGVLDAAQQSSTQGVVGVTSLQQQKPLFQHHNHATAYLAGVDEEMVAMTAR